MLTNAFIECLPLLPLSAYHRFHRVLTTAFIECLPPLSLSAHHRFRCVQTNFHCVLTLLLLAESVVHCTFDSSLCGLTQDSRDNFQWVRKSGSTSTSHTGPTADHTNSAGELRLDL